MRRKGADTPQVPTAVLSADRAEARAGSLRRLHGLVRAVNADLDLDRTLQAVCLGLVEGLGFGVAVVNLVLANGDLEVVACEGDPGARAALLGTRASRRFWDDLLAECEPVGEVLVDYRHTAWEDEATTWVPDLVASGDVGAWHPEDALLAPLRTPAGLVGVISVDLPADGRRPGPDQLELLEMYAAQASIAVENARLHGRLKQQGLDRARALGRLTAVVDRAPVAIVELDLEGHVHLWNPAAEQVFGWAAAEVLGGPNPVAVDPEEQLRALSTDTRVQRVQTSRTRRDGTRVDVDMTTSALLDAHGHVYGYLGVYVDVTARTALERELRTAAYTDPLTGLANRARFAACSQVAGAGAHVVLLDLDGFKAVNDGLGHAAGDEVLVQVAQRLRAACREDDLVARLGGDEFVVLLDRRTPVLQPGPHDEVVALAGRLVEVLAEPFPVAGRQVRLGASVGLARAGDGVHAEGLDLGDALLRAADTAMYAAKAAGKGRLHVFSASASA